MVEIVASHTHEHLLFSLYLQENQRPGELVNTRLFAEFAWKVYLRHGKEENTSKQSVSFLFSLINQNVC